MKKLALLSSLFYLPLFYGQVGINTNSPEAILDIRTSNHLGAATANDGILIPRVSALANSGSVDGLLVYLIADSGGFRKGFHFWNDTGWIPIVTGTPPKTVWSHEASNNRIKLGTKSDGNSNRDSGTDIVATDTGKLGVGTLAPNAKLDIRTNPNSISNPGEGLFGLGTSAASPSAAGAGAVRYNTASGGQLQFSNGNAWNTLGSTSQRSIVVAKKDSPQTIANHSLTNITDWVVITDLTHNFHASQGVFTAPRDGNYTVSFTYAFDLANYIDESTVESQLYVSDGTARKSISGITKEGKTISGSTITFTVRMNAGQTIRPRIYQATGSDKNLRVANGTPSRDGFVSFSVAEL